MIIPSQNVLNELLLVYFRPMALTWHLITYWLSTSQMPYCQPISRQVIKSLLANTGLVWNSQADWQYWVYCGACFFPNCSSPDCKVHGTYMGPTWGRQDPGGPHVGPMNLAIREVSCLATTGPDFYGYIKMELFPWWPPLNCVNGYKH